MYKKIIEGKKAIFFDLDGTIVDTQTYMNSAVQKVIDEMGFSWVSAENYYQPGKCITNQWKTIVASNSLGIKEPIENLVEKTHNYYIDIIKDSDLEPKEGFWDFIYELKFEKELKLALTTNSSRKTTEVVLEKIEATKLFDFIICGNEVRKKKPNPKMYKIAIKKLGVRPKEVTVFEDSLPGTTAAAKAKMDIVVMWDGQTPKYKFKGNILKFLNTYYGLAGNLDLNYLEALKKATVEYRKIKSPNK